MTAALCIFAWTVFSFAAGILLGRLIREGQRPQFSQDDAYGDGLTAADIQRVHSIHVREGAQPDHE